MLLKMLNKVLDLARPKCRWEDNIKILKKRGLDWIHVVVGRFQ
jgi:hypothetical protein